MPSPQQSLEFTTGATVSASAGNHSAGNPSQGYEPSPEQLAETALVRAAQHGDHQAYEALVLRHGPRLYHLLQRLSGDPEVAADLLQEVLVHAWQRLDRFAGHAAFGTWLWSVGRNRALDILRKRQPQRMDQTLLEQAAAPAEGDQLERQERHRLLHQGLAKLPVDYREIIILRDFQNHDYPTIAEILGIAEGTVKSRLSRARAQLRNLLADQLCAEDLP